MNIGLFTDMYYPRISGVVTSAQMLQAELTKLGHRVYIFTTTDPEAPTFESKVFRLPSVPLFFLKDTHRMAFFYPPHLIYKARKLKLDVIHTYTEFSLGFFGKLLSKMYSIPMVHTYHTMYEDYVHYIANGRLITRRGAQRYSRVFCNRADAVIAPTDTTATYLKNIGVQKEIHTIPTGLDFMPFSPARFSSKDLAKTRTELGLKPDDKVISVIGRVAKEKSLDVLIEMMPKLLSMVPSAKMLIVGDGPVRGELTAQAKRLGVYESVIFAGLKPWADIPKYYAIGDVFATASTSETQGLTYIEAMAARLPVVIKKDPAFLGLVRHKETGFIFEEDHEAADTVAYVLNNPDFAKRVARRAYAAAQPLSAEVFGLELEAVYREVCGY
ncbi:MAG: glycosyltransferase family 4 protein [Defluviitaleaceae bacterium]|nr:glycosyltransferase family 4 protein [Defluviitaleaceae bacterium]